MVLGQIGRGEVGSRLESVNPPGEEEVRAQTDELLEREIIQAIRPSLYGRRPGRCWVPAGRPEPSPFTPKSPTMCDSSPSDSMSSVVLMSLDTALVGALV